MACSRICRETIRSICAQEYDEVGFPSLRRRLMDKNQPDQVRQFLEEAGRSLHNTVRIHVGGSVALIMPGYVERQTDAIDIVGEVPKDLRENHKVMDALKS